MKVLTQIIGPGAPPKPMLTPKRCRLPTKTTRLPSAYPRKNTRLPTAYPPQSGAETMPLRCVLPSEPLPFDYKRSHACHSFREGLRTTSFREPVAMILYQRLHTRGELMA